MELIMPSVFAWLVHTAAFISSWLLFIAVSILCCIASLSLHGLDRFLVNMHLCFRIFLASFNLILAGFHVFLIGLHIFLTGPWDFNISHCHLLTGQ
jgi:hypothetical protein